MPKSNLSPAEYSRLFRMRTKVLRDSAGLSQGEMAQRLGIPATTYPKYESRSPLPHHLIPRFLSITGGSYGYLFLDAPDSGAKKKQDQDKPTAA